MFLPYFLTHLEPLLPSFFSPLTEMTAAKPVHGQDESLADWLNKPRFTGHVPNDLIAVGSTEIFPLLFQRRTSRASTYHSGEDTAATPIDSEVGGAEIVAVLASPLYVQEREASADPSRVAQIQKIRLRPHHIFQSNAEKLAQKVTHTRKSSLKHHSDREDRIFRQKSTGSRALKLQAQQGAREEKAALARFLSGISYENSSWRTKKPYTLRGKIQHTLMQESTAEHADSSVHSLRQHLSLSLLRTPNYNFFRE